MRKFLGAASSLWSGLAGGYGGPALMAVGFVAYLMVGLELGQSEEGWLAAAVLLNVGAACLCLGWFRLDELDREGFEQVRAEREKWSGRIGWNSRASGSAEAKST